MTLGCFFDSNPNNIDLATALQNLSLNFEEHSDCFHACTTGLCAKGKVGDS